MPQGSSAVRPTNGLYLFLYTPEDGHIDARKYRDIYDNKS